MHAPGLLDVTPTGRTTPTPPDFQALPGAKAYFGNLDGAAYRIEIPTHWNGDLVLWAHGLALEALVVNPPDALRQQFVSEGYAWAASSFSDTGFIPGIGTNDTLELKRYFALRFGKPKHTYIGGNSMGGNIVVLSLENFPEEYDGGLSLCGVVSGEEWIDYLMGWAMAAEFIAGAKLPLEEGKARVSEVLETQILSALGPPETPTVKGQAFASVIRNLTGGSRPFFSEGYAAAYAGNFGLVAGDPGGLLPSAGAGDTRYLNYQADPGLGFDGASINDGVRRITPDPAKRDAATHPESAPTTGNLQDPLLTLHETGDLIVPITMEQSYRNKVDAAGKGDLLVQRVIRGALHCWFSEEEMTRAWDDLVNWVSNGERPAGDNVLDDLSDAGQTFTNPLRPGDPLSR